MRPYLAIIRDSFHEALVSRVLWILLGLTTLFLAALAPLGIDEQAGSVLGDEDLLNREKLVEKIVAAGSSSRPSPGKRIWDQLDSATRQTLARDSKDRIENRLRVRALLPQLQQMLTRRNFYQPEDWAGVVLSTEAKSLAAKRPADLPEEQLARFNRLALEAAFPDEIAPAPARQVQLTYLHWELGLPLPVDPKQLFPAINQLLVVALATLLGVAGVFVAVLVTASMIPLAFEAGAVDLLLSKPIHRSWLFLAKFVGGCAFIAINAAYFIGGLWLLVGLRFGLWNQRLLLAIPLYLFLFAIYYGVSALAGLVWRNAIVSVVLAILFWLVCWLLGTGTSLVETLSLNPRRLVSIVPAGDTLIAVDARGEVYRWNDLDADWRRILVGRNEDQVPFMIPGRLAGPLYDPAAQQILMFKISLANFLPLQGANRLLIARRDDEWRREEGVTVPDGAIALLRGPNADVLTASARGIFRLEGNLAAKQAEINVFGLKLPLPQQGGRFVDIGPKFQLRPLESAAIDAKSGAIALFDGFNLVLFEPADKARYQQSAKISFPQKQLGRLEIFDGRVYLALSGGQVKCYDSRLQEMEALDTQIRGAPSRISISPRGRYLAVLGRSGQLWLYDMRDQRTVSLPGINQADVSALNFGDQKLFVVDRVARVSQFELEPLALSRQWQTPLPVAEKIYRYVLHPLYTILPKPGQLNQTVTYVLTSRDAAVGGIRFDNEETSTPARIDVWGPVWSNLAFLVVVLAVACVYVYRKDF